MSMLVQLKKNGTLTFLHRVEAGPADKSYGIHVAKLAGMPDKLLQRAAKLLADLEIQAHSSSQTKASLHENSSPKPEDQQLSLFVPEQVPLSNQQQQVIGEIKQADLVSMTPLAALNQLFKWQKELKQK